LTDIKIAPLTSQHSADISALAMRAKAHWGYSAAFMQLCRAELSYSPEQINHEDFHFVGAWSPGTSDIQSPIGFYALERLSAKQFELLALFVCPTKIGLGVGSMLLHHALKFAKAKRFTSVVIYSDPHAAEFYAKNGATRIGSQPSGSIPGRELPVYEIAF
tara:strand:+ start:612 stop:1094 length:483 start_codon:yes stop_codon:yes gene_type:complete